MMEHADSFNDRGNRRGFLKSLTGLSLLGLSPLPALGNSWKSMAGETDRSRINALLISTTTVQGKGSLEHAREALRELYGARKRILLINFASLPADRDAYAKRMQRDFKQIDAGIVVDSLHHVNSSDAGKAVSDAEAYYVSGGNTFLLLRELYDRDVVDLLREQVFAGVPYAGTSAGSNIGGICIGTTNDFPITDVPTRRSLGLFRGLYSPHHPEESDPDFGSRQWKIRQYTRYNPDETVVGVPNTGMLRIRGETVTVLGEGAVAFVQRGAAGEQVASGDVIF